MSAHLAQSSIGTVGRPCLPETPLQVGEGVVYGVSAELTRYRDDRDERLRHAERWARHDGRERMAQAALLIAIRNRDWSSIERIAHVLIAEDAAEDAAVRDQIACAMRGDERVDRAHGFARIIAGAFEMVERWLQGALMAGARS